LGPYPFLRAFFTGRVPSGGCAGAKLEERIMFDIRERVLRGDFVAGTWCSLPAAAEITGLCGFDWALLDSEHAPTTTAGLMAQMQALSRFLTAPIVRIPWLDRVAIKWSLDIGAAGIMVPYVETEEQAREAVSFMRYAPEGVRGVAGATRASDFGFGFKDYFAESNKRLLTVAQMETQLAVDNSRAIAAVDGVDVLFVGPMDRQPELARTVRGPGVHGCFAARFRQRPLRRQGLRHPAAGCHADPDAQGNGLYVRGGVLGRQCADQAPQGH
jgi:2-keto-3-deoxy-L-rhamnonate aldolase RhmA